MSEIEKAIQDLLKKTYYSPHERAYKFQYLKRLIAEDRSSTWGKALTHVEYLGAESFLEHGNPYGKADND